MKSLEQYIAEKLKIQNTSNKPKHTLFPKTSGDLMQMCTEEIEKNGNDCDLNHIDVSELKDIDYVFSEFTEFNGDISEWDVSNITSMIGTFYDSKFNGDISEWNTSNVTNMEDMFHNSNFTGENGDISEWNVSNVTNMSSMFAHSDFDGDISKWSVDSKCNTKDMFEDSPLENKKEFWPKRK